jgi:hypothetical protein
MNVDDGRIMRSWRSCLLYMFLAHLAKGQVNFCHYLVFVIRPLSVASVKLFILKIRVFESAVQIQSITNKENLKLTLFFIEIAF